MPQATLTPTEQALSLIGTPQALEVLSDLAHSRPPDGKAGQLAIGRALGVLTGVGAIAYSETGTPVITPQGRELHAQLAEIESEATLMQDIANFDL